jgi:hypothetical protein
MMARNPVRYYQPQSEHDLNNPYLHHYAAPPHPMMMMPAAHHHHVNNPYAYPQQPPLVGVRSHHHHEPRAYYPQPRMRMTAEEHAARTAAGFGDTLKTWSPVKVGDGGFVSTLDSAAKSAGYMATVGGAVSLGSSLGYYGYNAMTSQTQ